MQEQEQGVVEMGVLWEITSCSMTSRSRVVTVIDYEPLSNPGEALESLDSCSLLGLEAVSMRALYCSRFVS